MQLGRNKLERLLEDYVAGDLEAPRIAEVEALLQRDAKARALCGEIRAARDALEPLRDRPEPPVPVEQVLPRIRRAIAAATNAPVYRPRLYLEGEGTKFYRRLAAAAGILLAFSVGLLTWNRLNFEAPESSTVIHVPDPAPEKMPMDRLVQAGRQPMNGVEFVQLLRSLGVSPDEAVIGPEAAGGVLPVSHKRARSIRMIESR
ncbi:MAG: hypothetical protein O7C98_05200 [Planctomycetota bacterium]|nr:hypothetical protein [Planctomycetota bacterium]